MAEPQQDEYKEKVVKYLATMGMTPAKYKKISVLVDNILAQDPKPDAEQLITKFGTECYGTFDEQNAKKQAKKFLKTVYGSVTVLLQLGTNAALEKKANSSKNKMRVVRLQNPVDGFQEKIGNYLLGEQIGEGATSKVYLGRAIKTKKPVALKILKVTGDKFSIQSLQKEITVLKTLKHPHVNGLIDCYEKVIYPDIVKNGDTTVMVLELSSRGELYDYIHATGAFEPELARWCFEGMMKGLKYCHDKKVVHRDLKPENVLLDKDYVVKLVDFGFARFFDDGSGLMTTRLGTPGYVAPEILKAKKYTKSVDIFTMGVILFSLYSGFPPFREQKKTDWWWDKLSKPTDKNISLFWRAHEQAKEYTPEFKDLVNKMLTFDPTKRITSEKILNHAWVKAEKFTQEQAAEKLAARKIQVDEALAKKAAKVKPKKAQRALDGVQDASIAPPVRHALNDPIHCFLSSHLAISIEDTVKGVIENKLLGETSLVSSKLYVGEMVDKIDAEGNEVENEQKAEGHEWMDIGFTINVSEQKTAETGSGQNDDEEEALPSMTAGNQVITGKFCVRQHATKTNKAGSPLNICYFTLQNKTLAVREKWNDLFNALVNTDVCALIYRPESEYLTKQQQNMKDMGLVDDLAAPDENVGGGCLPSCGPSSS